MSESLDEDLSRKLAVVSALRIALVTVSLAATLALTDQDQADLDSRQFTLISLAYGVSLLYALVLRLKRSLMALAYIQVVVDALLVSVLVATTGGIESVFTAAYVFVVIGGAITLFRRGAILATASSLLLMGTLALIQVDGGLGSLGRAQPSRAALSIFTSVISLSLVAALASTLTETARATGRRLAERESDLERLQAFQAAILRSLPAGLMTLDPAGVVRFVNEAATTILGRRYDEVVGLPLDDTMPSMSRAYRAIIEGGRQLNARERYEGSYTRADGGVSRVGFSFAPLAEAEGSIVVFQDLTDIVRLKEAFERAERLATIGKLAAALAHEVRNPLSSMCASIDVLKGELRPPEPMRRLMDNVVREGARLDSLITDFLRFARPRELARREVDLVALCKEMADLWRLDAEVGRASIELVASGEVRAMVDPDLLRQVLWNLARNAAQAMPAKDGEGPIGKIVLGIAADPPFAVLTVKDDGRGMEEAVVKRIFDPFYTTRDRGTGLGLAIVHSIVEGHGGTILASSTPGRGTEMVIRLPIQLPLVGTPVGAPSELLAHDPTTPAIMVDAGTRG